MTDETAGAPDGPVAPEPEGGARPGARAGERVPASPYEAWQQNFAVDGRAFGRRVRELRTQRGWSLKDLHHASGVPAATLSELENGQRVRPRADLTMTLAEAFGAGSPAALLGLPGPPPRPVNAEGPGPMTLEKLVESLLRGIWAAQGSRPPGAPEPAVVAPGGGAAPTGQAVQEALGRLPGGTPVIVGAVFLVEPKTVG